MRITTLCLLGILTLCTACDSESPVKVPSQTTMVLAPEPKLEPPQHAEARPAPRREWIARVNGVEIPRIEYERLSREQRAERPKRSALLLERLIDRELLRQHVTAESAVDPVAFQKAIEDRIDVFGGPKAIDRYLKSRGISMQQWRSEMKIDFALSMPGTPPEDTATDEAYEKLTGKPVSQPRFRVSSVVVSSEWVDQISGRHADSLRRVPEKAIIARTEPVWVQPSDLTPNGRSALEKTEAGRLTTALPSPRGPMFFILHERTEENVSDDHGMRVAEEMVDQLDRARARDQLLRELRAKATIEHADEHQPKTP